MLTKRLGILGVIAILPAFAQVSSAPPSPDTNAKIAPRRHDVIREKVERGDGTVTSGNWSGYAVTGSGFTKAEGSWKVPAVSCSSGNQYASFWVGIDGYSSKTVEQTGTESDCSGATLTYYAWYEFCCKQPEIPISSITVLPGDTMSASIVYASGKFTVTITDERTGQSFKTSKRVFTAKRTSAEWIAEAPYSGGILPLADFGTVLFGYDNTGITGTNYATDTATNGPIGVFPTIEQITMAKSSVTEALPTSLSSDGTSFSVTWFAQ